MDLPRVTEILKAYTSYDQVPAQILQNAATRGTKVHAICAGIASGNWIPESMIDEELRGYVKSFQQWAAMQVKEFIVIEKRYHSDGLGFTGQIDFVVRATDDKFYLVDLKTSAKPQKTYPLQMGAYDLLIRESGTKVEGAMLVYLNKTGEFPEINLMQDTEEEIETFLAALLVWKYLNKGKKHGRTKGKLEYPSENPSDHGGTGLHI